MTPEQLAAIRADAERAEHFKLQYVGVDPTTVLRMVAEIEYARTVETILDTINADAEALNPMPAGCQPRSRYEAACELAADLREARAERDAARNERNIMLKWLRTVDEIDKLLGVPNDASPEYTLKVWTAKITALKAELAEAKRRFEQLAFLYRAERADGWGDDTDSARRLAYDAETEAALRQE